MSTQSQSKYPARWACFGTLTVPVLYNSGRERYDNIHLRTGSDDGKVHVFFHRKVITVLDGKEAESLIDPKRSSIEPYVDCTKGGDPIFYDRGYAEALERLKKLQRRRAV